MSVSRQSARRKIVVGPDALFPVVSYGHGREFWRAYGLILAWPLNIYNIFTQQPLPWWIEIGAIQTFVLIPLGAYADDYEGKNPFVKALRFGTLQRTIVRHEMPHASIDELRFPLVAGSRSLLRGTLWRRLESSEAALLVCTSHSCASWQCRQSTAFSSRKKLRMPPAIVSIAGRAGNSASASGTSPTSATPTSVPTA